MTPSLFDSHAHLDHGRFDSDLDEVLERALTAGVKHVMVPASGARPEQLAGPSILAGRLPGVWAASGVHPHEASSVNKDLLRRIHDILTTRPRVMALGEIGLDYHYNLSPQDVQRAVFEEQCHLALDTAKPVIVHVRDAHEDAIRILKGCDIGEVGGVIHCFTGDLDAARAYLDMGLYISFSGILTYAQAEPLRRVASELPLDRLLVETDAPYLAPEPHRGKRCEPAHVAVTLQRLAEVMGEDLEQMAVVTRSNTRKVFNIEPVSVRCGQVAYTLGQSVYLNLTNRCNLDCRFCLKRDGYEVLGYDLKLGSEPCLADALEALMALTSKTDEEISSFDEVVFCGLGEPTLRLDLIKELAFALRRRGAGRLRLNTDGLASLVYDRDIPLELSGLIDAVSVSLNASDASTYARLCPSRFGREAFEAVKSFIRSARANLPEVQVTAVGVPELNVEAFRRLAQELGVRHRIRNRG